MNELAIEGSEGTANQFFALLTSVHDFDKAEVFPVVSSIVGARQHSDTCFIGTYYRARGNVESLLCLNNIKHFQALAMLARSVFELAVDVRLLKLVPAAVPKMLKFVDVEKLRVARQVVGFCDSNPSGAKVDSAPFREFIQKRAANIEGEHALLWPERKRLKHWSGDGLRTTTAMLREPFERMYLCEYPQVSWQAHSGLTGMLNLEKSTFELIATHAFKLAAESYCMILETIITEYKLESADSKIQSKLTFARLLPFTESDEQRAQIREELLG